MKSPLSLVLRIFLACFILSGSEIFAQDSAADKAKLPGSPAQIWDVLFNIPLAKQMWGLECDGISLYGTNPYDTGFAFSRFNYAGTLIANFNIPGVPKYGPPNYMSPRDMCYDGQYFYVIYSGSPCKIYKLDLNTETLLSSMTLPFNNAVHLTFDQELDMGNGGFWCGSGTTLYSLSMSGTILSGPVAIPGTNGSATDLYSVPGQKFLWFSPASNPFLLKQYDPATSSFTGITHSPADLTSYVAPVGYGLSDSKLYEPGKNVLMGCVDSYNNPPGSNYRLFGYELGYTVQYPIDVGVIAILSPVSGQNLGNAVPITITVRNFGLNSVSNFPVSFSVNGVNSVTETIPGTIPPGSQVNYTFTATADMHWYNIYEICAQTSLIGDPNPSNDGDCVTLVYNFTTITDTIFPQETPNWTGTVSGPNATPPYAITQNSLIGYMSGNVYAGWAKFPLSGIPPGVQFSDIQLHWFLESQTGAPYLSLKRLLSDPITTAPAALYNAIKNGVDYVSASNLWNTANSWYYIHLQDSNTQVLNDLYTAVSGPNPWWAVGFYNYENCPYCYFGSIHGWNQVNEPFIVLSYHQPIASDVGVDTILLEPVMLAGIPVVPKAKVRNYGTNPEFFSVTMTSPGGYSSTRSLFRAAGQDSLLSFDTLVLSPGNTCFTATAVLATDLNLLNQTKTNCIIADSMLSPAYGFINDPAGSGLQAGPVRFYLEHPEVLVQITPTFSQPPITSGTFGKLGTADTWFAAETLNPPAFPNGNLVKTNPSTGVSTPIGPMGVGIDGLTYNYAFDKLFGISSIPSGCCNFATSLYELNTSTGQATFLASLGVTSGKIDNLGSNANGMLFFTDTKTDYLYALDPLSFIKEKLGPAGQDLGQGTDMEFDRATNILYVAGPNTQSTAGGLYKFNAASGESSFVNNFPSGIKLAGMAIPYTPPVTTADIGILWIKSPVSGNLGINEYPGVRIANYGTTTAIDFDISYQVGSGPVQTLNWVTMGGLPLLPGNVLDFYFNTPEDLSAPGIYCLKAWTSNMPSDNNQLNDTASKCITNTACTLATLCYPNALPETEICGDYLNGGCSMITPAFENISPGDARCGDVWKVDTLFDQDWYQFTITAASNVYVAARTEFDLDMHLVSQPCSSLSVLASHTVLKCGEDTLVYENLPPGTYALVLSPNLNNPDLMCGLSNRYSVKFTTIPAQATIHTSIGTVNGPCPGFQEIPIYIDSCYLVQQFHLNISLPPGVQLMGFNNLNPAFNPAYFSATQTGNQVILNWFSLNPVSPGSGLLINLMLSIPTGTTILSWTTGPDSSFYANGSQGYLPASFQGASLNFGLCNDLSGLVLYAHKTPAGMYSPYPVGNPGGPPYLVKVVLKQGNTILYTAFPDSNGQYSFFNLANGNYTLTAVVDLGWTGVNMIDAQLIMQNFVHGSPVLLTSPWLDAGDVNGMGAPNPPNSLDALLIARRFVGIIPNFMPPSVVPGKPDWYSESFNISINGTANQTKDIRVLCTGDVNGSN